MTIARPDHLERHPRSATAAVLAGAFGAFLVLTSRTGWVRVRYLLPLALAALAGSVVVVVRGALRECRRDLWRAAAPALAVALFAPLLAIAAPDLTRYDLFFGLVAWLMGWAGYLLGVSQETDALPAPSPESSIDRLHRGVLLAAVGGVSLGLLFVAHRTVRDGGTVMIDETLNLLQARLFGTPGFGHSVPTALQPFFMLRQEVWHDGRILSQYPPGWPAILGLFDQVGAAWAAAAILGALVVVFTILLGERLHSRRVGLVAAALLLLQPLFMETASGYSSHAASTLFLLLAAWLMVGEGGRRIRPLVWIAIGVCVGLAFGIRPLTGLAMTASLAGWYLLRSRPSLARAAGAAAWTALGAAGPTAAVLYYNTVTTGDPLQFGYVAANGALHHLGFGLRGFLVYNQAGLPRPDAHAFSAALALRHVGDNLWGLLLEFLPSALLAPLLIVAARQRFHWPWATMALFALVPLAYAFWFYNRMQYSVDLFPYAFIGIAILLEYLRERQPALVRSTALYLVVVLPVAPLAHLIRDREVHRPCRESYQAVGAMRRREQLLLFVEQRPTSQEMLLECLSVFNTHGFSGDVVVARDLGASDSLLMSRLPGHTPWRVGWDDSRQRARIERFR